MTSFSETVEDAPELHKYIALGRLVKEYMSENWYYTNKLYNDKKAKRVYYFSMEFLIGKLLLSNMQNMGIEKICRQGLTELGISLDELVKLEPDAGLGNGGLGRLAACFLDSMASISIPGTGMGIRYRYGLFEQRIINGYQVEVPDNWLSIENVWEVRKYNEACLVRFGGDVNLECDCNGKFVPVYRNYETVLAVPYDMPVPGYINNTVNTLRLWSAENYYGDESSLERQDADSQYTPHTISQSLYPDDSTERGKLLRLKQEYFFVCAGIQSIIRNVKSMGVSLHELDKHVAIHINDTHPAVAVAELMRILLDEEGFGWDEAWNITVNTCAYTNHTIMAEALERWNIDMFKKLLPRIYMIIEEINRRFCHEVAVRYANDWSKLNKMSIIQDGVVKMAHLAIVGSHSVNGVAQLHTDILKFQELKEFNEFYTGKFNNKTNGITHRRWLLNSNPELSSLITEYIGYDWIRDTVNLRRLERYSNDDAFLSKLESVKRTKKRQLADFIYGKNGVKVDENSIFDIQVKRLHGYKRQLLNVFNIMNLYNRIIDDPDLDIVPRTFIFAAKSFPSYRLAKEIIKLINCIADVINNDTRINNKIKVVFLENYGVSLAEIIIPAGDVSEQISTASKEASGTGNMKFMMNGAVTMATLDGANVEICQAVGQDNIFLFGLKSEEVIELQKNKLYNSQYEIDSDHRLGRIVSQLRNGFYSRRPGEFDVIYNYLYGENDEFFVLKDFASYVEAQNRLDSVYRDRTRWNRMSLANIANSGIFSSDITIKKYADEIWNCKQCK